MRSCATSSKTLLSNLHIGGCNAFVNDAVIAAYTQCDQWLDELNAYIKGNMDYFCQEINGSTPLKIHCPEMLAYLGLDPLPRPEHDRRGAHRLL